MATFSSLPNELVIEIWRHVLQPEDIERFAMASKKIRILSSSVLLEHRKLTRDFSYLDNWDRKSKGSVAGLLKEILTNPRIALYVKRFGIFSWRDRGEASKGVNTLLAVDPRHSEEWRRYWHTPYAEKDMKLFEQAIKRAENIFGNVESLIEGIKAGREDPIIALLLLFLTNLQRLTIQKVDNDSHFEDTSHFFQTLQYVSSVRNTEALTRLVEVKLLYGRDYGKNLPIVKAFAALPSVKRILAHRIGGGAEYRRPEFDLQTRSSNVENLAFHHMIAGMDSMEFFDLIEGFKGLKHFSLQHRSDFDPFWIRAALVMHAKHSLETLILRSDASDKPPIGTFRSFEVLKKLELDHTYLVDNNRHPRPRLADVLPSSLEELHLHDFDNKNPLRLNPLWAGKEISEDKDTRLPNLKVVVFCDDYSVYSSEFLAPGYDRTAPGIASLQAACNAKGFRLDIRETPEYSSDVDSSDSSDSSASSASSASSDRLPFDQRDLYVPF